MEFWRGFNVVLVLLFIRKRKNVCIYYMGANGDICCRNDLVGQNSVLHGLKVLWS